MAIQKAEELALQVDGTISYGRFGGPLDADGYDYKIAQAADLIRADRKAVIERCKEQIKETFVYGTQSRAISALDEILRELD